MKKILVIIFTCMLLCGCENKEAYKEQYINSMLNTRLNNTILAMTMLILTNMIITTIIMTIR